MHPSLTSTSVRLASHFGDAAAEGGDGGRIGVQLALMKNVAKNQRDVRIQNEYINGNLKLILNRYPFTYRT